MKKFLFLLFIILVGLSMSVWGEEFVEKKDPILPTILNIIPGLGIGSFVMGDPAGGLIGLGGEILGIGLFGYGVIYIIGEASAEILVAIATLGIGSSDGISDVGPTFMGVGILVWLGTKVFEVIRPSWFAAERNSKMVMGRGVHFRLVKGNDNLLQPAVLFDKKL